MQKRLLIVDDDQSMLTILKYAFDNKGYEIFEAGNGEVAMKMIQDNPPDVIIMDVLMPKVDGFTLLKNIRSKESFKDIPVIIMSAVYKSFSVIQNTIRELGATDYFTKPFDLKRLVEKVQEICPVKNAAEAIKSKNVSKYLFSNEVPLSSEFRVYPPCKVYANLIVNKKTGVLIVTNKSVIKRIFLRDGIPLEATSNVAGEWLGRLLVRDNILTVQQYEETLDIMQTTNKKHGEVLIEKSLISPHDLYSYLKKQIVEKISNTFSWSEGAYSFSDKAKIEHLTPKKINPFEILLNGVYEKVSLDFIKDELSEIKGSAVFELKDKKEIISMFELPGAKIKLLDSIDGNKGLSEIFNPESKSSNDYYRIIYALLLTNSLRLIDDVAHAPKDLSEASTLAKRVVVELTTEDRKIIEKVSELYDKLQNMNFYQLLSVPKEADNESIKKSYFRLAKDFHPDKFSSEKFSEVRGRANKIFSEIATAYQTLSHDHFRKEYDAKIMESKNANAVTQANEILAAEMQFQKGTSYLNSKNYKKAYEAFSWAVKLNPDEAEYHLYYAITIFKDPESNPMEARLTAKGIIEKVISMNDNLDLAHYYLGIIYKLEGNHDSAKREFSRAARLNNSNVEAVRELRLMEMRNKGKSGFLKGLFK